MTVLPTFRKAFLTSDKLSYTTSERSSYFAPRGIYSSFNKFIFLAAALFASQLALAISEEEIKEVSAATQKSNGTLKELSIRQTYNRADELLIKIQEGLDHEKKSELPAKSLIWIPDQKPLNKYREILVLRYFTQHAIKETDEATNEANLLLNYVTDIADKYQIDLITIRPTVVIKQELEDGSEKDYHFEMSLHYYKEDDSGWKLFVAEKAVANPKQSRNGL